MKYAIYFQLLEVIDFLTSVLICYGLANAISRYRRISPGGGSYGHLRVAVVVHAAVY